jgi:hypothetical protein
MKNRGCVTSVIKKDLIRDPGLHRSMFANGISTVVHQAIFITNVLPPKQSLILSLKYETID